MRGLATDKRSVIPLSIVAMLVLGVVTLAVWAVLPLTGNADHAVAHLSLAVPVAFLFVAVLFAWPPLAPGGTARLVRSLLLISLAVFAGGLVVEALGAFGFAADQRGRINGLATLHDVAVHVTSAGFIGTVAAGMLSVAVSIAGGRGVAESRVMRVAVVLAIVAVVAFEGGSLIYGY